MEYFEELSNNPLSYGMIGKRLRQILPIDLLLREKDGKRWIIKRLYPKWINHVKKPITPNENKEQQEEIRVWGVTMVTRLIVCDPEMTETVLSSLLDVYWREEVAVNSSLASSILDTFAFVSNQVKVPMLNEIVSKAKIKDFKAKIKDEKLDENLRVKAIGLLKVISTSSFKEEIKRIPRYIVTANSKENPI